MTPTVLVDWGSLGAAMSVITGGFAIISYLVWNLIVKPQMSTMLKETCAGKAEFDAHAAADLTFQETLVNDITDKRNEYTRMHGDHYRHSSKTEIHQTSMPREEVQQRFETVKVQVADVGQRVAELRALVEKKLG